MKAKGGRPPKSASERVHGQGEDSHSSSIKSNVSKTTGRERDDNHCVLTGEIDIFNTKNGHQVAHFIPQSVQHTDSAILTFLTTWRCTF